MKCIPFSNAFTIIMEIYYMCSTFVTSSTPSAQTNREKEKEREICVRILFISSWNQPNYVWYLTCAIFSVIHWTKAMYQPFRAIKCAHHFLLTLFEWYLPLGFWWSKIQFHFREFIIVHCLVKVRAFPEHFPIAWICARIKCCEWLVRYFSCFHCFVSYFEQILWYNNKIAHSGVHLFSGNFSRSTQNDTPSNHTIARFIAGAHQTTIL